MNKLPVYELFYLPDESNKIGMESVSLVDEPAISTNFIYFDKDIVKMNFSSDEEMIVKGPALIPDQLIYRNSNNKERYIYFSKETIKKFAMSFLSKNNQKVNIDHSNKFIDANIVESYFVTDEKNEFDVKAGSWIVAMKINDKNVWNDVKAGKYNGFSIQGMFSEQLENAFNKQQKLNSNMTLKEQLINAINKILFDESEDEKEPMIPTGETTGSTGETVEQKFEEVKPEEPKVEEPKVEEPKVDEPKVDEPKVDEKPEEVKVEPITEDKISEMIIKSQSEMIEKMTSMIKELNDKIDAFGNTPVPANPKKEEVVVPRAERTGAARFI